MIEYTCKHCAGSGIDPDGEFLPHKECPLCGGSGKWPRLQVGIELTPERLDSVKRFGIMEALGRENKRLAIQRNLAIATVAALIAWNLFCLYLIQKLIERAL